MTDFKKLLTLLYAIFAASIVMQVSFWLMVLGTLALVAVVCIAYHQRKKAAGGIYESHFTWIIRTFWIGTGVYLPVITVVESVVLWSKVDIMAISEKLSTGEITDPMDVQNMFMAQYGDLMRTLTLAFALPFAAWWLWRCWAGYSRLKQDRAVDKPQSWL